jgi:hypothetical protein
MKIRLVGAIALSVGALTGAAEAQVETIRVGW